MSETPEQDWIKVGETVIVYTRNYRLGNTVQLKKIESVAPKSFVVHGMRFKKDNPHRHEYGAGFGPSRDIWVVHQGHPKAPWLLAVRQFTKVRTALSDAMETLRRDPNSREAVVSLVDQANAWLVADEHVTKELEDLKRAENN